jgi:enterochelin esterase-like enzyme
VKAILTLTIVTCGFCWAQTADDSQPAPSNVMGAQYPRVHSDSRVTFALTAPTAQKVQVSVSDSQYDMVKGEGGVWSVTTPPLVPGFHYYSLAVDGVSMNDPGSETYFGYSKEMSGIEVPEKGVDYYQPKDVPHGEVRSRWYYSKTTGVWRRCFIYTPPDYDTNFRGRYPVLYLQHGAGEDERGWSIQGRMNFILDNLIAAKKAKPMLVVMDKGYATKAGSAGNRPPNAFEDVMIDDLIPTIDSTYRTIANRDHRAMAGLSMGGGQTFQITLKHLDLFAYIGVFSGAGGGIGASFDPKTAYDGALSDAAAFNKKIKLVWVGVGTAEPERLTAGIKALHAALEKAGIKHIFYESPGTAHEWLTWRRDLNDFAPRLF